MMIKKLFIITVLSLSSLAAKGQHIEVDKVENPVDWVSTLVGTDSQFALSNGNTYPAIALPWGMNFWTPQTGKMGDGWIYSYSAYRIRGIKQTHQPSPWINDYGQFSIMPTTGNGKFDQESRASWFSHKAERATPYYYSVYLADYDITAEVTPTERAAQMKFTYPENSTSNIIIDAFDGGSYVKVIPSERKIIGYSTKNSGGVPSNFKNWFVIISDTPFSASVWSDTTLYKDRKDIKGSHVGALVSFATKRGQKVGLRVASSFISAEQAELNLNRELGKDSFEVTKTKAYNTWNKELGRIAVSGGNAEDIKTFYSSLYRLMLFPRKFYEINSSGRVVHYSPYNGEVLPGYMFTDNGFWDTFRAVFPFFSVAYPTLTSQIMEGLVNTYNESGWLPEWASPGHRDCMIGSNSTGIIAEAYLKGIRGYDIEKLYEAAVKGSGSEGPLSSVGRRGADYYNSLGYIPYDVGVNENVARTLEYAYADYALMRLAESLGRPKEEIELYKKRSQNYRNVFDNETLLMRGKNKDGSFQKPFNPFKWGDAFTEGNSWHYTWSVFHDPKGLINLMGGRKKFVSMLDSLFVLPPIFDDSYYGFPIHEIREMQIAGFGNYAHGNQPIQHAIYLYNYAGEPWKSQYWSRRIMTELYNANPDGYSGDEDNGQTSAWFVFSAMGFYPVAPVTAEYVIGSPLFKRIELTLENGKKFVIDAQNNSPENVYIQSARLNGLNYNKTYITHKDIISGGTLRFNMGANPNKNWGTAEDSAPYSYTK